MKQEQIQKLVDLIKTQGDMWLDMSNNFLEMELKDHDEEPDTLFRIGILYQEKADLIEALDIVNNHKKKTSNSLPIVEKIRSDLKNLVSDEPYKFTNHSKPLSIHNDKRMMNKVYDFCNKPGKKKPN